MGVKEAHPFTTGLLCSRALGVAQASQWFHPKLEFMYCVYVAFNFCSVVDKLLSCVRGIYLAVCSVSSVMI